MLADELDLAREVAVQAGEVLRTMQSQVAAREKAPADLVTEADLASQQLIRQRLEGAFPQYGFLGEEQGGADQGSAHRAADWCWLVDPLDGTTNYVHGLDNYSVSIALRYRDRVELGVVFDPTRQESFWAIRGQGAWLDGVAVRPSDVQQLDEALVAASFPARVTPNSDEVQRFLAVLYRAQAVRRLGSAALNLAYVACGRLDAYWASSVKIWDVAAASLLVEEAGGVLTSLGGGAFSVDDPQFVAASTPSLHTQLLGTLTRAKKPE